MRCGSLELSPRGVYQYVYTFYALAVQNPEKEHMEYPRTTKHDIEDGVSISILAKVTNGETFDDGNERYQLTDIEGNSVHLKIWAAEADRYDIETGNWYLFQEAEGDLFRGDRKLSSNRGDMEAIALDEPPEFVDVAEFEPVEFGELTEGSVLALDIETISTVPETEIDLENSDHVELLCIGVGFAPAVGSPGSSRVLFRRGSSSTAEVDLLERFCEYVEARDPDQLLVFKGDFDVRHLRGRAARVDEGSGISDRVNTLFDTYELVNLDPTGSLEENADVLETHWDIYNHSLNPADWRADHPNYRGDVSDPVVTNKDIPYFGKRYLQLCDEGVDNREYRALHELLRHYTISDIDPLFSMIQ